MLLSEALICYFVALKYIGDNIHFAHHCHIPASMLFQIRKCFVVATSAPMMHCVKSKAFDDDSDETEQRFPLLLKSGHFTDARK